jgi:peptide/nickel transport system permease protein
MPLPMISLIYIVVLVFVAIFGEWLAPFDPEEQFVGDRFEGFSADHWLSTDDLGRDVFSRVLVGTRISMISGFVVTALSLAVAIPLGLLAGYIGGTFDLILLRVMDALRSFPGLVLVLSVAALLGPSLFNAMIAISLVIVPGFVRLIRAQTLSLREETFIEASQSIGTPRSRILRKHIVPGVLSPLVVAATLLLGTAMLIEASLSFLGYGEPPPAPSWGNMLQRGFQRINSQPEQSIIPGAAIALAVLSFNLAGDGLRDAMGLVEYQKQKGSGRNRMGLTTTWRKAKKADQSLGMEAQPEGTLLAVRDLRVEFSTPTGTVTVVDGVSFDVKPGEVVGLVGESGCGKSVTSSAIMRIISSPPGRIRTGEVWFDGRDLLKLPFDEMRKVRGNDIAMVFQDPMSSLNPGYTIGNQMVEAVRLHKDTSRAEATRLALDLLDKVNMPNPRIVLKQYPHNLSGGMRQRVLIAMALINRPKLIICDEPTTALDVTVQAQILELLKDLQREFDMGIIFVTHDLGVVADICDRVQVMYAGEIIESADIRDLFNDPRHPYSTKLLEAMPQATAKSERLTSIPGTVPPPMLWPAGCHFSTRCEHVTEACLEGEIPVEDVGNHLVRCIRHEEIRVGGPERSSAE